MSPSDNFWTNIDILSFLIRSLLVIVAYAIILYAYLQIREASGEVNSDSWGKIFKVGLFISVFIFLSVVFFISPYFFLR